MDIALDYYRIFEAVARHRSFTRAAEALVNSQPNLTRAVHNLEAELGCRLFLRSSRGVELTPEGEALYAHVTAAMEQLRAGEAELQRQRELRSGMVSIACSETALHAVLLQVLSRFHRENPAIRLRVSNQSAPEAIDALRSGLAELAVVTMPPAPLSAPLEATVLASFREVAVCSTAFPLDSGRTFTLREIAALPLIALRRGTSTFDLYESLFRRHGLSYAPDIEAATSTQLLPLVKNGLGIAFVPDVLLPAPGIERLHLREGLPERAVCLIRRTDRPRSVAAAALETMLLSLQNKYNDPDDPHGPVDRQDLLFDVIIPRPYRRSSPRARGWRDTGTRYTAWGRHIPCQGG